MSEKQTSQSPSVPALSWKMELWLPQSLLQAEKENWSGTPWAHRAQLLLPLLLGTPQFSSALAPPHTGLHFQDGKNALLDPVLVDIPNCSYMEVTGECILQNWTWNRPSKGRNDVSDGPLTLWELQYKMALNQDIMSDAAHCSKPSTL